MDIDFNNIEKIDIIKRLKDKAGVLKAVTIGEPNVLITLKTPVIVQGIYGIQRKTLKIAATIDDAARFEDKILRGPFLEITK